MKILKKIPHKQLKPILMLVTLIIVVSSYFFGYQKYSGKAELLEKENKVLINDRNELQEKNKNKEALIEEINEMKDRKKLIMDIFPSDLTQDKNIVFINNLANNTGMEIMGINLSDNELFYPAKGLDVSDTDDLLGYKTKITISYSSTYEDLKECLSYINNYNERMNIPTYSATFNNTSGNLSGTMTIDLYSLSGGDVEFEDPLIEGIPIGRDNIFKTFETSID